MINIKIQAAPDKVADLLALLKESGLTHKVHVEDPDAKNLRALSITQFYKRINAANLAQQERRVLSPFEIREEVAQWQ